MNLDKEIEKAQKQLSDMMLKIRLLENKLKELFSKKYSK